MEKDDEVSGEANSYDFGARMYNPRVGRWMSCDQLEASYADLSPYNYVSNNPIIFIDPDGREIKLPPGLTNNQKLEIVGNLQKLTNDKLVFSTLEDGSVQIKIASLGEGKKDSGTSLLRELNSSEHTITIDYNNSLQNPKITANENETLPSDFSKAQQPKDGTKNVGSDVVVNFAPEQLGGEIYETDPVTLKVKPVVQKNMEILLGHELIHAEHMVNGTYVGTNSIDKEYVNYFFIEGKTRLMQESPSKEEMRTVGLGDGENEANVKGDYTENKLRNEAGLNERGAYSSPPSSEKK